VTDGIEFGRIEAMTFDCYGTLIDWEAGIASGFRTVLDARGVAAADDAVLEAYARQEAAIEAGPYLPYREVLARAMTAVCAELGVEPTPAERMAFATSVGGWPAFADSAPALASLARRYRLGVITNSDDDLFAASSRRLGVAFDWIITAQQVRSYKPNPRNFELALDRIGLPRDRILHVAQSLFHDHMPAKALGLATAWINRRHDRPGFGATPAAVASPDLEAPDMASFATLALGREPGGQGPTGRP
jgi:2-haloacid dehalogenase